jgi:hypothetical protein
MSAIRLDCCDYYELCWRFIFVRSGLRIPNSAGIIFWASSMRCAFGRRSRLIYHQSMDHRPLRTANSFAFKEWAAVCAALAAGRQTLILRKGGIHEAPGGFRPEHREFWLLPTRFHQQPAALRETDRRYFEEAAADAPAHDQIRIGLYAAVAEVIELADAARLPRIEPLHVYGAGTVRERFHYRRPGLYILSVRVYRAMQPIELPIWPQLAGCRSWVELPAALSTAGLAPVFAEDDFAKRQTALRESLA